MVARAQLLSWMLGLFMTGLALLAVGEPPVAYGAAPLGLIWWPAGGLLAAFCAYGGSVALLGLAADFFVHLSCGALPEQAALGACLDALPALALAAVMRRLGLRSSLTRLYDVALLAAVGAGGSALAAGGLFWLRHASGEQPLAHAACLSVGLAHAVSVLLVAPALLVWSPKRRRLRRRGLAVRLELAVLAVTLLFVAHHLAPLRSRAPLAEAPPAAFVLLPAFLWAATRFGQRGAISALAAVGLGAVALRMLSDLAHPASALAAGAYLHAPVALQVYACVALLCVLIFGSVIEERREAIRLRDDFLLIASHELKTPLTALMLGVENLERRMQRETHEGAAAYRRKLGSCHAQIDRLARLVDGLLDVSRISGRTLRLRREQQDLTTLVQDAAAGMQTMVVQTGCSLKLQLPEQSWGLYDRHRILQLLQVLLENACKYGAGKPVHVTLADAAQDVRITVQDEGIGVAPQDAKRIFRRFERAVSTHSYGGLGLGLFVAHKIAVAHGGELKVDPSCSTGARFVVRLPRRRGPLLQWLYSRECLPEWLAPQAD